MYRFVCTDVFSLCGFVFVSACSGFTPLILAATAGHMEVVEMLVDIGANMESQSERTKDTPLSLACSGGRYEVAFVLYHDNCVASCA